MWLRPRVIMSQVGVGKWSRWWERRSRDQLPGVLEQVELVVRSVIGASHPATPLLTVARACQFEKCQEGLGLFLRWLRNALRNIHIRSRLQKGFGLGTGLHLHPKPNADMASQDVSILNSFTRGQANPTHLVAGSASPEF